MLLYFLIELKCAFLELKFIVFENVQIISYAEFHLHEFISGYRKKMKQQSWCRIMKYSDSQLKQF